ncbi:MAG TPA: carboxymuconolactone decarboxylase family protein [Terracidiphilus sp.]|jgi:AhpD family alkylhydroperoxidase|nr:carboxymuconolactone decarboxylase family protein [Terracidiphilus sp.]
MSVAEAVAPRLEWKAFQELVPEFTTGMAGITHALRKSGIEPDLREFVKIRASQLNGCAFCVQFHLNDARKLNVAAEKLDLLAVWREAGVFSPREMAALDWTERVTLMAQHSIDEAVYARVQEHFSERDLTLLTVAISQINAWNRIAAPFRFTPPIPGAGA